MWFRLGYCPEIAKRRYNSIENDLRAVAGMYAKVKIRHFDGKKH